MGTGRTDVGTGRTRTPRAASPFRATARRAVRLGQAPVSVRRPPGALLVGLWALLLVTLAAGGVWLTVAWRSSVNGSASPRGPAAEPRGVRRSLPGHGARLPRPSKRVADCREACGARSGGATADGLLRAARGFGLQGKGYALEPEACARAPLPAIVHWDFNHFVVLERWSPRHVDVVDPAVGQAPVAPAEFDAGFTGVLLAFQPGRTFQRRGRGAARRG